MIVLEKKVEGHYFMAVIRKKNHKMKLILIENIWISLFLSVLGFQLIAQDCPSGDQFFSSQEKIDDFIIEYPTCKVLDGDVFIGGSLIENIDALSNIEIIEGLLVIDFTIDLINTSGFSSLSEINGGLEIIENFKLENIEEITQVDKLQGDITISQNRNLKRLIGFESDNELDIVTILENENLDTIDAFHNVKNVNGSITVSNNDKLLRCNIFNNLDSVDELFVRVNSNLETLDGFDKLEVVENQLNILSNNNLNSIPSFNNLVKCGSFTMSDFKGLFINGFNSLEEVRNDVFFQSCSSLEIIGFNKLEKADRLVFQGNRQIQKIAGFNLIDSVNSLTLTAVNDLEELNAFNSLESIETTLQISEASKLDDLLNFESITSIKQLFLTTGVFDIPNNFNDLSPFEQLDIDYLEEMYLFHCINLQACSYDFICDFLEKPDVEFGFGSNASGCNSAEEILAACNMVSTSEQSFFTDKIHIVPNPVNNQLLVDIPEELEVIAWNIYSVQGRSVLRGNELSKPIDVSLFENGIYFLNLELNRGNLVKKVIVTR